MEASQNGIDVGGRVLDMLLAFLGDTEDQHRVYFRVKGKKVIAAATAKNRAIEVEGKAAEGSEEGEWPVEGKFLRKVANCCEIGSAKVTTVIGRLLCQRTGVSTADLIVKDTGALKDTLKHHGEMPQNKQLSFALIHKTIKPAFDKPGSWYPLDKKLHAALNPVYAALGKGRPISIVGGKDEQSPVGFQAKGEDFTIRGILVPPAVQGPGREAVDADDDDDGEDDGENNRQPNLFEGRQPRAAKPAGDADDDDADDAVISDEEADELKAKQANGLTEDEEGEFVEGNGLAPLPTEKARRSRKSASKGTKKDKG